MKTDSELTAKFSNIYINLLYSIMIKDLNKVKHFLSEELINKYERIINELEVNNETQLYDELNVGKIDIIKKEVIDNKEIYTVKILSRYMDYKVDEQGDYLSGNNKSRIEKENILKFEHNLNSEIKNYYKCKYCGNNLDINYTGECSYCNNIVDISEYEYILTSLEIVGE